MNFNEYVFKYEYEERKKQLDALIFTKNERMTPIKKSAKKRLGFNPFLRKKRFDRQ